MCVYVYVYMVQWVDGQALLMLGDVLARARKLSQWAESRISGMSCHHIALFLARVCPK